MTWGIFKSLIPTFGEHSLIMLTYYNEPKVWIKLLKIPHVIILFLISLLYVAVINPYSVFKFLIFKYSSLFTFYSILKYIILMMVTSRSLILVYRQTEITLQTLI